MTFPSSPSEKPTRTNPECRWCKGTGRVLGFAWESWPCECAAPPPKEPEPMLMYAGVEQPSKKSWAYDLWMNEGGGYLGRTFPVPGGLETWEVRVGPVRASEPEGRHWLEVETPTEIHSNEYWTRAEAAARGEVIMGLRTLGHFRACQRDAVTWMDPRLARPSKVQSMLRQLRDEGVLDA